MNRRKRKFTVGRIARYPRKQEGGATYPFLSMDTNPPDDDHWYYDLAEKPTPEELAQREDLARYVL